MSERSEVSAADRTRARDRRRDTQRDLLAAWGKPLVSFTMNMPGPIKNTPLIRAGFDEGVKALRFSLESMGAQILEARAFSAASGPECLFAVDAPAREIKRAAIAIEESGPIGRLCGIDVIGADGVKLERNGPRKCLLREQARARGAGTLLAEAERILRAHFEGAAIGAVAERAQRALLYELLVTPKPGLVDRANSGAHADMDVFTFAASAAALYPWFARCAREGLECREPGALLARLRAPGLHAEMNMREATGGVNTHKGAIFSLGILCAAAGYLLGRGEAASPEALSSACVQIAGEALCAELDALKKTPARTAGEKMLRETGMTGARGEAARGFPTALKALDALEGALDAGRGPNEAGVEALLLLIAEAEDSNFVRRASAERRLALIEMMRRMPGTPLQRAGALDALFIRERISPGGAADLLAVAFFLRFARELAPVPPCSGADGMRSTLSMSGRS